MLENFAMNWVVTHQQLIAGIVTGYAIAYFPDMVLFLFDKAMDLPWFGNVVLSNPTRAKQTIDKIRDKLEADIDRRIAAQKAQEEIDSKTITITGVQAPPPLPAPGSITLKDPKVTQDP